MPLDSRTGANLDPLLAAPFFAHYLCPFFSTVSSWQVTLQVIDGYSFAYISFSF